MPSPTQLASSLLRTTRRIAVLEQQVTLARRPRARDAIRRIQRARLRREKEWWTALMTISSDLFDRFNIALAHRTGLHVRDARQIAQSLELGASEAVWVRGGIAVYLQLALETGAEAAQLSLEQLGLNRTFAWAHPRAMANDLFAVRGSKVIQNLYGYHRDKLADIILRATDPLAPLTLQEVEAAIADEWPQLTRAKVAQIARTETAAVWTQTQVNAYAANGIERFRSIVASGPAIGVEQANPCPLCVEAAASLYGTATFDLPPWHPSCRCVAVPVLVNEDGEPWLPPQEPWVGQQSADLLPVQDF